MDIVRYPSVATIKAFGGLTETANALGLKKQNVDKWKRNKSGLIPRWWSDQIKAAAESKGIKLPKARKVQ